MKKAVAIIIFVSVMLKAAAQSNIVFQHLNTTNGLSYIGVNDMCTDRKGNLWIATGNGLNMFNGKTVEKYYATEYPQLQNSNVIHVTCDSSNRIWVLTLNGNVTMLDEKRQLHRAGLYENNEFVKTRWILNSQHGGIILFTEKGHYAFKDKAGFSATDSLSQRHFTFLPVRGYDTLLPLRHRQVFYYDDDQYLLVREESFYLLNYRTRAVEKQFALPHLTALIKWGSHDLLAYDRSTGEVKAIDLLTGQVSYPFRGLTDQSGKPVTAIFNFAEKISADKYILTTTNDGIYIYQPGTRTIFNYRHHIADPGSISNNIQTTMAVGQKGWVFLTCNPHGISYFNANDFIGNQNVFTDNNGNGYDGYIAGIATKDNNTYFIGTVNGMLEWQRNTNTTSFLQFKGNDGQPVFRESQVTSIVIDSYDQVWATAFDNGIIVMDKNRRLIKHIQNRNSPGGRLKIGNVVRLTLGPDGYIWACGRNGISRINPRTFETDNFADSPLRLFDSLFVAPLLFTDRENCWIATSFDGLYHYNLVTKKLEEHEGFKQYKSEGIFDIQSDTAGNIYVGNRRGVKILYAHGGTRIISQKEGLLIDGGEGLLRDKYNRIWIGNDIGLVCYNPADSGLRVFDERYGLSIYGFRIGSYFQTSNGEFVFGTPKGLQYFHPDSLFNRNISLNALINRIESKSVNSNITESSTFRLSPSSNQVTFYFSSVDFSPHLRTYYEYRLSGIDPDWIKMADQNSVRYNSLPPGQYVFNVRVSNDNKNWQNAENEVTIIIAVPFYKSGWFKLAGSLLGIGLIWVVLNYYRNKQKREKEQLETEVVINYFASQINSHQQTDNLLWDVAKNCISRLGFEDCVIYLLDEQRQVLVQKAAYGPKNPLDFTIHQPIEIPLGQGITGQVAQSGIPEIIPDTEADERYIVDDKRRYSEITVPIFINNKVVGIIDSEHSRKHFFTPKHLGILQTIAVLCANQIQKTRAEEERHKATIELLENKQKAVESRLQSLRLQMNPHFLFNALNSVQQMILANEEMVATRYLSRFSKLLRAILVHSDKEMISLKEELEILHLYVELESIRFKESFRYSITCDESVDTEEIKIPTLLVQPFVENAIWHGLMHKEGERVLKVAFSEENDFIRCIVEDNGIGRKKAAAMKIAAGQDRKHTSKGIEVSKERLKTIHHDGIEGSISILDLVDANGEAAGTRVEISFPIQTS